MRMTISVGDINEYGIEIVSGPYLGKGRGSSTTWDLLCKYCKNTFISPTTKFKSAKSCYECRGFILRKSSEEITWKNHYGMVKARKTAKEKGFNLTIEQFIEISKQNCFYCNDLPTLTKGHRPWSTHILTNGLDRVDSSVGYLYNNVVACCKFCNFAKLDKTEEEFYSWVKRLAKHQSQMGNM
jgi:hypothetical protein